MNTRTAVAAILALGLALGVPAVASAEATGDGKVKATLTGAAEVPGPGDPNGKGQFHAEHSEDGLCYSLSVSKVARTSAAHIHAGDSETAGPIVVTLKPPLIRHPVSGCITAVPDAEDTAATLSESELAAIKADPTQFYVNVHNDKNPAGAVRGQLS